MSAHKALPLTKEEVMFLVELIRSHPVLFSKATNASNNKLKEDTWIKLTASFNSMIASNPRKPDQLRLKWENLKKAARKRSTKMRMNNLTTGGVKPDYITPDKALDKVASILRATCDGFCVPFGGDAEKELAVGSADAAEIAVEEQNMGKLKRQATADNAKASVIAKNRAIAEYYEAKKKQESIIAALKKRKLELEILEIEIKTGKCESDSRTEGSVQNMNN